MHMQAAAKHGGVCRHALVSQARLSCEILTWSLINVYHIPILSTLNTNIIIYSCQSKVQSSVYVCISGQAGWVLARPHFFADQTCTLN